MYDVPFDIAERAVSRWRAEAGSLEHLGTSGNAVRASAPVRSRANRSVETEDGCAACVLTRAPGIAVTPDSPHWNADFVREWGVSLSVLRRRSDRGRCGVWLFEGYRSVRPIDARLLPHLDTLIQLRILYVLLSRLKQFGPHPDDTQRATLAALRAAVLERFRWPMETLT